MKIFILGTGKSGTTALVYKVAAGLPNCQAFSGGHPGKYVSDYDNAVYKHTYEERKGKSFDLYRKHLDQERYDRKIWMTRDPRDVAVSRMLYRWHRGYRGRKGQFRKHLALVLRKEQNPSGTPFHEICRYAGHGSWPISTAQVVEEERLRYEQMYDFVKSLGPEWFLFKYEDMVHGHLEALNAYLGFKIEAYAEVPKSTGKAKVVRKKASGDWRHWFTEEDVALFKPAYLPYMELMGYDCEDWTPASSPCIEPAYSSTYMRNLPRRKTLDTVRHLKDLVVRRLSKRHH